MSRIFIADDHPIIQAAIGTLLKSAGHDVVGKSASGAETLERLETSDADILILDMQMPGGSGIETLRQLRARGDRRIVLVLTASIADETIRQALDLQVSGILLKTSDPSLLIDALRAAGSGKPWIDPALMERVNALTSKRGGRRALSQREIKLITLVREGLKNREIAEQLNTTEGTIKAYLHAIFDKVGVENRTELATKAAEIIGP